MSALLSIFTLIGSALFALMPSPDAPNCALDIWIVDVGVWDAKCNDGLCSASGYTCNEKNIPIGGLDYSYCKCTSPNGPTMPDGTECTSVMTYDPATTTYDFYCVDQACLLDCHEGTVSGTPAPPCFCH